MSESTRISDTVVICPIVYGSVAYSLGKKADEGATHKWTIFIRGPNDEDLSTFISGVYFTLHPSFAEPLRFVKSPPFEVTEAGWGEFEVGIRIIFRDYEEQPIDLSHQLKLYPPVLEKITSVKKPVVSETYDEVVFTNPHENFYRMLMLCKKTKCKEKSAHFKENYTVFDDQSDVQQLTFISDHILNEIEAAKAKLLQLNSEYQFILGSNTTNAFASQEEIASTETTSLKRKSDEKS